MATSPRAIARLTAVGALAATTLSAFLVVTGPWQPASVVLGAVAIVVMGYAVFAGSTGAVGLVVGIEVVRLGIQAISGDPRPGAVVAVMLLVLMVELAGLSFDARTMPTELARSLARIGLLVVAAGLGTALVLWSVRLPDLVGVAVPVVGITTATVLIAVLLGLHRRSV